MRIQAEFTESLTESLNTCSRVRFMLKAYYEVVRLADNNARLEGVARKAPR